MPPEEGAEEEAPEPGGDYSEHKSMALDDLADIVGVSPEDRGDFDSALSAYVHAAIAEALKEGGEAPESEPELPEE